MSHATSDIDVAVGRAFAQLAVLQPVAFSRASEIVGLTPFDVAGITRGDRRMTASEMYVFSRETGVRVSYFYSEAPSAHLRLVED